MAETGYKTAPQSTARSARNLSLSNYYNQQREMSSTKRSNVGMFRTRLVTNNFRGKPIDKITEHLMKTDNSDTRSIYQQDYTGNQGVFGNRQLKTAQSQRVPSINVPNEEVNSNAPNTQRRQSDAGTLPVEVEANLQINTDYGTTQPVLQTSQSVKSSIDSSQKKMRMKYTSQWEPFFKIPKRVNKIGIDYKRVGASLYQRDYVEHPTDAQVTIMKNDFYTTPQKLGSMSVRSTMQSDYKGQSAEPPTREGPNRGLSYQIPFGGNSNYRREFVNWGSNASSYERAIQPTTIIPELKLSGRTLYKDNFGTPQSKREDNDVVTKKMKELVFSQSIPFLGESNYQKDFRGFRVTNNAGFQKKNPNFDPTLSYSGNFRSTFRTDFKNPEQMIYWPGQNEADDEYLSQALPAYSSQLTN